MQELIETGKLKILSTIFLFTTILIQTFSSYIIQADFYMNQSYIAKTLCVNKDKPMMHCNGKCYLAKKLNQQDQQAPAAKNLKFDIQPFFVPNAFKLTTINLSEKINYYTVNDFTIATLPHVIFHPPTE